MTATSIEWTDYSWNPLRARDRATGKVGWFCVHVHDGCRNCYAETMNRRLGNGQDYIAQNQSKVEPFLDEKTLLAPLHWKKPRKIFVCSMTDLFGDWVKDEWLDQIFTVAALCPQHTFIVLTKRPERMRSYLNDSKLTAGWAAQAKSLYETGKLGDGVMFQTKEPLPNVWGLVSCSEQKDADEFIPILLRTPLAIRGVSLEPLLGPIDLTKSAAGFFGMNALHINDHRPALDWVIVGGESGPKARPMHPQWAREIRDQCAAAGVPFFFKQWGEYGPSSLDRYSNDGFAPSRFGAIARIGKRQAGRLLDGKEHNEFPMTRVTGGDAPQALRSHEPENQEVPA